MYKTNITQTRLNQSQKTEFTTLSIPDDDLIKRLLLAIRDRFLTTVLEILEEELGLEGEEALLFLRKLSNHETAAMADRVSPTQGGDE